MYSTATVQVVYLTGTLQPGNFHNFIDTHFIILSLWYNNKIINMRFDCKGDAYTSVLPFYITVTLSDAGRNYRPKHVVVNEMNKLICSALWCCGIRRINTPIYNKVITGPWDNFATVKLVEILPYIRWVLGSILGPSSVHTDSSWFITVPRTECPACHRGGPGWIPGQFMWDLWWKNWQWDRFVSKHARFGSPLLVSFHNASFCHRYCIISTTHSVVK
jgi:hypothetical protein